MGGGHSSALHSVPHTHAHTLCGLTSHRTAEVALEVFFFLRSASILQSDIHTLKARFLTFDPPRPTSSFQGSLLSRVAGITYCTFLGCARNYTGSGCCGEGGL